jgi:hypothetical protein
MKKFPGLRPMDLQGKNREREREGGENGGEEGNGNTG